MPKIETAHTEPPSQNKMLQLAGEIVEAYVSNNVIPQSDLPSFIKNVYIALNSLGSGDGASPTQANKPAVPVKKSISPDYIVCLEDGKKLKMLKRYLRTNYSLTPEAYRQKWGLPLDYPMVAPNYAARRSEFAKKIGLGRTHKIDKKRKRA